MEGMVQIWGSFGIGKTRDSEALSRKETEKGVGKERIMRERSPEERDERKRTNPDNK